LTWVSFFQLHHYSHRQKLIACETNKKKTGNNIGHPILDGVFPHELKDAIAKILDATRKAGKKCGIYCSTGVQAKAAADQGFDMISVSTDYTALEGFVKQEFSVATGATATKSHSY
jgi:4-hydroxy-2-oxoheptanedioate aldolase